MLEIYKASCENVRELKSKAKVIKKMFNAAIRDNKKSDIEILTKVYALLYSAFAEVSFLKLIHTPHGFDESKIIEIQKQRNLDEKWKKSFELAFKQIENSINKGEVSNKKQRMTKILNNYIINPSQIRNKIAHGQWRICLNNNCTEINNDSTTKMQALDFVKIDSLFYVYETFEACIEDLIESPNKAHYKFYYYRLSELEQYIEKPKEWNIESKIKLLINSPKNKVPNRV